MRNIILLFSFVMVSITTWAQSSSDFYIGKWDVEIKGTSGGDQKMEIKLFQKDGKLQGNVSSKDDGTVEIKKIEENDQSIKVYFKHGWFTVNLLLEKEDENNCSAKLMGKYDGKCKRIAKHSASK